MGRNVGYNAGLPTLKRPVAVTVLGVLPLISAALYLLVAVGLFVIAARMPSTSRTGPQTAAVLLLLLAGLSIFIGVATLQLKAYARIIQIIGAFVGLLAFPLGTILSILVLVYLFKPEVKILFSERRPEDLTSMEQSMMLAFERSGSAAVVVAIAAVVVFFVMVSGIVAAIAIPNLLNAIQRGKQKRTMADMRAIATACEAYAVDNNQYPSAENMAELVEYLVPAYIPTLSRQDAWQRDFIYLSWASSEDLGNDNYMILSGGKDGLLEHQDNIALYNNGGATHSFNDDIAFSMGTFVQWPEGIQH